MAKAKYLLLRGGGGGSTSAGGRWSVRLHIPTDLKRYFSQRKEIKRSLHIPSYTIAKSAVRLHLFRTERVFLPGGLPLFMIPNVTKYPLCASYVASPV